MEIVFFLFFPVFFSLNIDWIPNYESPSLPMSQAYRDSLKSLCHSIKINKEYPSTLSAI